MDVFSRRYGYNIEKIQLEYASDKLKLRIMAAFYKEEFDTYEVFDWTGYTTGIEDMMIEMGAPYKFPKNNVDKQKNVESLQKFILDSSEWYTVFDFIERYLAMSNETTANRMAKEFNRILKDEVSAYRIIDNLVVPVTNEGELTTLEEAINSPYDSVSIHITKALALYAERKNPDYENSIKESISAVEAMCCIITGMTGAQATLGNAIKQLKNRGVHIHNAMEKAFLSLYGYTSDESGIRHGGMRFNDVPPEDAKYMLISCSAFINYLVEKWNTINSSSNMEE